MDTEQLHDILGLEDVPHVQQQANNVLKTTSFFTGERHDGRATRLMGDGQLQATTIKALGLEQTRLQDQQQAMPSVSTSVTTVAVTTTTTTTTRISTRLHHTILKVCYSQDPLFQWLGLGLADHRNSRPSAQCTLRIVELNPTTRLLVKLTSVELDYFSC